MLSSKVIRIQTKQVRKQKNDRLDAEAPAAVDGEAVKTVTLFPGDQIARGSKMVAVLINVWMFVPHLQWQRVQHNCRPQPQPVLR